MQSDVELFSVYSRANGALLQTVNANVDTLVMSLPSDVIDPGARIVLNVSFDVGDPTQRGTPPNLGAWIRRLHAPYFASLAWNNTGTQMVTMPKDSGVYHIRVTPGIGGNERIMYLALVSFFICFEAFLLFFLLYLFFSWLFSLLLYLTFLTAVSLSLSLSLSLYVSSFQYLSNSLFSLRLASSFS